MGINNKLGLSIFFIVFLTFCTSKPVHVQPSSSNEHHLNNAEGTYNSFELLLCNDFISLVFQGNTPAPKRDCDLESKTTVVKIQDSLFQISTTLGIDDFSITYRLFSKKRVDDFSYANFDPSDYIKSDILINQKRFLIDSATIQPEAISKNEKINFPLTIGTSCQYSIVQNKKIKYLILQLYPPCGGSYCDNNYLFIFRIKNEKPNLTISKISEAHPLFFEQMVYKDISKDGKIDFIYNFQIEQFNKYLIMPYSFKDDKSNVMTFDSTHFIEYSCERCVGEMTDTITINKKNWW